MDARSRLRRRWTLGRLMILIAVLAVPLAVIVQQRREIERMRREAEMARDVAVARERLARKALEDLQSAVANQPANPLPPAAPPNQEAPR